MKKVYHVLLIKSDPIEYGLEDIPVLLGQFKTEEEALILLNFLQEYIKMLRYKHSKLNFNLMIKDLKTDKRLIKEVYSEDSKSFTFVDTWGYHNTVEVFEINNPENSAESLEIIKDLIKE